MRICFDATPLIGSRTGVGFYTSELIAAVAAASPGDDIVLLPITWRRASLVEAPPGANIRVVRRPVPARPLWAMWRRAPFPPVEWFVGCDVFHATNYVGPPSRRIPTVVTVHDLGFVRNPAWVSPAILRMAELLPTTLRRAAAIIAVSQFTADELAAWMPEVSDRITVVRNGGHRRPPAAATPAAATPAERGGPIADGGRPYALVMGIDPRKNLPLALDALAILRRKGSELRLVVAGGANPLVDLDRLVTDRELTSDDVVCTGYADDARAASLLAGARLLAFPSLYEGFGMPLVEAMAAGTPVVAARAGATPEVAGDAALLTDPSDAEAFADAIERVATDDELRAGLIEAGRARAAQFTWERSAAAILDVYRRVATCA